MTLFRHAGHNAVRVTVTTTFDDGLEQVLELAGPDLTVETLAVYPSYTAGRLGRFAGVPDEITVRVGDLASYVPTRPRQPDVVEADQKAQMAKTITTARDAILAAHYQPDALAPIEVAGSIELDYSLDLSGWRAVFEHARMMTPPPPPPPVREEAPTERWPFDPPYTTADLPQLDRLHDRVGLGPDWRESSRRAELSAGLTVPHPLAEVAQLLARVDPDPIVCPECAAGKCGNCDGTAWDHELDEPTACLCIHPKGSL